MALYYGRGQGVSYLGHMLRALKPAARAIVRGSEAYPAVEGYVTFYPSGPGVVVAAEFTGLPGESGPCAGRVFGFHIHEGTSCTGTAEQPFADALSHFNPDVQAVADRVVVLRRGRLNGEFDADVAGYEQIVAAITGVAISPGEGR